MALDDFGSGYSNFEHLMRLNVDFIKIDGSMIKGLDTDANSRLIVQIIAEFAKKLGVRTVAEFVHSGPVFEVVKELGIDYSQGYHFGKPEPSLQLGS